MSTGEGLALPGDEEARQITDQDSYEQGLQAFANLFNIIPKEIDDYRVEVIYTHSFGVPTYDERVAKELVGYKADALHNTLSDYQLIDDPNKLFRETVAERQLTRRGQRVLNSKQSRKDTLKSVVESSGHKAWLELLAERAKSGIWFPSSSMLVLSEQTEFSFNNVFDWGLQADLPAAEDGNVKHEDIVSLFTYDEMTAGVTRGQLAQRALENGGTHYTKQNLDARFDNIATVMKLEAIRAIVSGAGDIAVFRHVPRAHENIRRFIHDEEATFALAGLDEIASSLNRFSKLLNKHTGNNRYTDPFLRLVKRHMDRSRNDMSFVMHAFNETYNAFGYERPAFLEALYKSTDQATDTRRAQPKQVPANTKQQKPDQFKPSNEWQEYIDEAMARIAEIELPYVYTASRIRSFASGTAYVRQLEEQLGQVDLLHDRSTCQLLAMFSLQSQRETDDKLLYFQNLAQARSEIQSLLTDLTEIDPQAEHASILVDTLGWVDEVVDSGADTLVTDNELQSFIYEYWVGPDQGVADEPIQDEHETVRTTDTSTEHTDDRLLAQKVFGDLLAKILEHEQIEYVDLVMKPLGGMQERQRRQQGNNEAVLLVDIDPQRLLGLLALRDRLVVQGNYATLYFIQAARGQKFPPFILNIQPYFGAESGVCLVENPVVGYASRVYPIDGKLIKNWQEAITTKRQELAELDIKPIVKIHKPKGSVTFDEHYLLTLRTAMTMELARLRSL